MIRAGLLVAILMLAGCGPSCEERGGERFLKTYMANTVMVGKIPVTSISPVYGCKINGKEE